MAQGATRNIYGTVIGGPYGPGADVLKAGLYASSDYSSWGINDATGTPQLTVSTAGVDFGAITLASMSGDAAIFPIKGLDAATAGAGGTISVTGGAGSGANAGGAASLTGGASGAGATGAGGAVSVVGGAALSTNGAGGAATQTGGAGSGTGAGGAASQTGGASGAGATGNGGASTIVGGAALSTNGTGGAVGGTGGAGSGSGSGGAVLLTSGAAGATGVAGAITLTVGAAIAGNGSAITLNAGNGAGGTNSGGNINLVPGAAVSTGIPGEFQINSVSGIINATWQQFLGTNVPASGTSYPFFLAARAYRVKAVSVYASSATTPTVDIFKDTGTNAPGAGTSVLTGAISFSGVANTVVNGTLSATVATLTLAAGDRLSAKWGGTVGSLTGAVVNVLLVPV